MSKIPPSVRRRQQTKQWTLLISILIFFGALAATALWYEKQRVFDEQFGRLSAQAQVIDDNVVRQLEVVSNTLAAALSDEGLSLSREGEQTSSARLHLKALAIATLGVRSYSILNDQGNVVASGGGEDGLGFPEKESIKTFMAAHDAKTLYMSPPFMRVSGEHLINLVRVSTGSDGQVKYAAVATLSPDFFTVLLSSVRYEPDVWVSLAHIGGDLVMRFPERPDLIGINLNQPGSFFYRHLNSGQVATALTGVTRATGQLGWMAQRTISAPKLNMKGALVVAVARDPKHATETVNNLSILVALIWLAMALLSAGALVLFQRRQVIEARHVEEIDSLRRDAEQEIKKLALYDPLTELPNRRLLLDRMRQLIAGSSRQDNRFGVLFIDLDGFKQINDSLSHECGDLLLHEVALRLQSLVRQNDTAARWGGDEFVVVLTGLSANDSQALSECEIGAKEILSSLSQVYDLAGQPQFCTASIGVALFERSDETAEAILRRADDAMHAAKLSGKNAYRFHV